MSVLDSASGFIVCAWQERRRQAPRIFATGRLADGRSFALILPAPPQAVYVEHTQAERASEVLRAHFERWVDFKGQPLARFETRDAEAAARRLDQQGVKVIETERAREALLAMNLSGPVTIRGRARAGRRVDLVFTEPELSPSASGPELRWLALDIETSRDGAVTAASLAGAGGPGEVFFVGAAPLEGVTVVATEKELLARFAERLRARDPDVITGWNVIDFDLEVLARRFDANGVPFDIARTPDIASVRERASGRKAADVAGRAVLDALRLVRGSGQRFDDQTLDSVAQTILGEGKTVSLRGEAKLEELERMRRDEPATFCAYCLRDAELVLEILRVSGLDALTARRAALTGVSLELAWTSIPAFERIYGASLRERRILPPPRIDTPVSGAAGGTVLDAEPGLFSNVLVFDFRSLYPTVMRTFHVDPLAHARAMAHPKGDDLIAPNGARFDRTESILPEILTRYAHERERALAANDDTAAYVYKILQNSFYGVLGSPGCRYGRTELAGAITSFGRLFLTSARDWFTAKGHRVLYGDTDSLFVELRDADDATAESLLRIGHELASALNHQLTERIEREYHVHSHLFLRCEKLYRRFFISRLRSDSVLEGRGRAKGYAGLRRDADERTELEVRGMEAARSDFTPLARRFQLELFERLFAGATVEELRAHCDATLQALESGQLDNELVYRKSLRRAAEAYDAETPQVHAARLLGWTARRGRIDYVMTRAGAEPIDARSAAPLDYAHYRAKQLLPIAQAIVAALGVDAADWFDRSAQLPLFTR